jgi:hypothetical protein
VTIKAGIVAFTGANGDGKTLCAIEELVLPAIRLRLPVLSNVRLDYEGATLLRRWRQMEEFRPRRSQAGAGVLLLDDVSALLPARQAMAMPVELVRTVNTLRKRGVQVGWTDPAWEGADTLLRRVTKQVVRCRGMVADRWQREDGVHEFPFRGRRLHADGLPVSAANGFGWAPKCLFRFSGYEASAYDQRLPLAVATGDRKGGIKPLWRKWYWRPAHQAHRLYDTTEEVELLDWVSGLGTCLHCGLSVRRQYCKCPVTVREDAAVEALDGEES